jgi:hypothetical protein
MLREIRLDASPIPKEAILPYGEWHKEDLVRFFDRVWIHHPTADEDEYPCWLWVGETDPLGYGLFVARSVNRDSGEMEWNWWNAHRWIYSALKGRVPSDHLVSHTCDHPDCVRPDHLFLERDASRAPQRAGRQVISDGGGRYTIVHREMDPPARKERRKRERHWQRIQRQRRETGLCRTIKEDLILRCLSNERLGLVSLQAPPF